MKVAVIGANGQLGLDVCDVFKKNGNDVVALDHRAIEVSDLYSVKSVLQDIMPDIVLNTSAMHNVEKCEEAPEKAFAVNGIGARNLALISNDIGYTLMHISTDYVFDGEKRIPYVEADCPNPLNVYGNTKLSGELFIQNIAKRYFILRVSGLYGTHSCRAKGGLNFVRLMLKLAKERDEVRVVDDEILTPTYTADITSQILHLARWENYGVYHVTAQGQCSWYEFARKIFDLTNTSIRLSVAEPGEFPSKTPRPKFTVLENKALQDAGIDIMRPWTEGLESYLNRIKKDL